MIRSPHGDNDHPGLGGPVAGGSQCSAGDDGAESLAAVDLEERFSSPTVLPERDGIGDSAADATDDARQALQPV